MYTGVTRCNLHPNVNLSKNRFLVENLISLSQNENYFCKYRMSTDSTVQTFFNHILDFYSRFRNVKNRYCLVFNILFYDIEPPYDYYSYHGNLMKTIYCTYYCGG